MRRAATVIASLLNIAGGALADGADRATIVPRPAHIRFQKGEYALAEDSKVIVMDSMEDSYRAANYLAGLLCEKTGLPIRTMGTGATTAPRLELMTIADDALGDEGYRLDVTERCVSIRARTLAGHMHAIQTLRQLFPPEFEAGPRAGAPQTWRLPCVEIRDSPRFAWRGMLLDCARHFMDKAFIKRYIDLLAYHKLNVLHWHLTEDQGWRVEIKRYPQLTEVGAWRRATRASEGAGAAESTPGGPHSQPARYGGFYTREDVREIVAYAAERGIMVVPEIEMPGHSLAALASYPELSCTGGPFEVGTTWGVFDDVLCAGNEQTFEFLEGVLSEVIALFPGPYVHIGGDECPKTRWKACPKCQARIKAEGLKDEAELQSYFVKRIERFLDQRGRKLIGWDEILEGGLPPRATVQSWRGMDGAVAAAREGHDVIASPTSHCYLDYAQWRSPTEPLKMGFITLEKAYRFEPLPAGLTAEQAPRIRGVEGNIWTEHAPQPRVDWQVFPRLCALAEVGWSPREARDWADFSRRLETHARRLDGLGVTYFIPPPTPVDPNLDFEDATELRFEPPQMGEVRFTLDGSEPTAASPVFSAPLRLTETTRVRARTYLPTGRSSELTDLTFSRLAWREPVAAGRFAPGLAYALYEGRWTALPDFAALTPAARGVQPGLDLKAASRTQDFGLEFSGVLIVPRDGLYTFYLSADDGARLQVGGATPLTLEARWDGGERRGRALLRAGAHPIRLAYFQIGGQLALQVSWEGPGVEKQALPSAALRHAGE